MGANANGDAAPLVDRDVPLPPRRAAAGAVARARHGDARLPRQVDTHRESRRDDHGVLLGVRRELRDRHRYQGNQPDRAIAILTRTGATEIKTTVEKTPRPQTVVRNPVDVDATWIFTHADAEGRPTFSIDRGKKTCHTPRRNDDIDEAFVTFGHLHAWYEQVVEYFQRDVFSAEADHGRDLSGLVADSVFVPVVPLFEDGTRVEGEGLIPRGYLDAFVEEERRSLTEKCRALSTAFPKDGSCITAVEAGLVVTLKHAKEVGDAFAHSLAHIELMLGRQLADAIGKEISPAEFTAYMNFHHKKLVKEPYRPRPFSYAIRRPDHDPEGVLSIEAEHGKSMADPISTTVASSVAKRPMSFAIDASTQVSFTGERHLHAWLAHRFADESGLASSLVARARQFSSFILLVGRIASADVFEPKFGVVLQNKDVVKIPLLFEEVPTPKQFRDAIESLSPEQQRFARAFRGMQLESTLFGVLVVQVKPQLEKLLKLPADSLTKEIKLTQELMNLFVEYQIPSDLLSYDGPAELPIAEKLARVTEYVGRMREMIDLSKKRELEEEREREAMRLAEQNRTPPPPSGMAFGGFGPPPGAPPLSALAAAMPQSRAVRSAAAPPMVSAPMPPPAYGSPPPPAAFAAPAPQQAMDVGSAAAVDVERGPAQSSGQRVVEATGGHGDTDGLDYTKIPLALDRKFEELDEDAYVHAAILHTGDTWSRTAQKGLLTAPTTTSLGAPMQKTEKNKAFDLLDALTKSGALAIDDASLHVVVAATHRFDRTLLDTVLLDNINPIEKVERSLMIASTTIFDLPASELLADDQRERFLGISPRLGALPAEGEARRRDARRRALTASVTYARSTAPKRSLTALTTAACRSSTSVSLSVRAAEGSVAARGSR